MVNMNDVAKKAGVSRGTVSNYINGVKIKEVSRLKVEAAIKELDYIPNLAARELKTNQTSTVVFILPNVWNPFFSELTFYLQLALKEWGQKMLLCNSLDDYQREIEYIEMANQNKVTGIISISYSDISPFLSSRTPYVAIERYYNQAVPFVSSDNFGGSQLAVAELVAAGAKNLLHVSREVAGNKALEDRRQGFEAACEAQNLTYDVLCPKVASEDFRAYLMTYFKEAQVAGNLPDGLFCGTDRYASYCLDALMAVGVKVPEDVQLIGFDGSKSYPTEELKISTIRQPVRALAKISVQLLKNLVEGEKAQHQIVLPVTFLKAGTTR